MLQVRIKKKLGNFLLDVDFSMDGGIFAILGASGCGKSMTLKCIAGIERPDEGRIVLNDRVLFDSAKRINLPPQKRKVGYMFQDYALFPAMNVVQNIQAGMGRKPDPKKVREYITGFQLGGLEHHMPDQLSRRTKTACGDGTYAGFGAGSAASGRTVCCAGQLSEMENGTADAGTFAGGTEACTFRITQQR